MQGDGLSRRSLLAGMGAAAALALAGCTSSAERTGAEPSHATDAATAGPPVAPTACDAASASTLWRTAIDAGLVYGSSTATWQISDHAYRSLFEREAAILFTEDDLLWYRVRPSPTADVDLSYGDRIVRFARENGMLVLGAHLVWDEGFGEGWTDQDVWGLSRADASRLLFGTVETLVRHYRGDVAAWIVANEVVDPSGPRTNVPWYATIGPSYVPRAFELARDADPDAELLINDYGFETDDDGDAAGKRAAMLDYLDGLLADGVPVTALGVQAHLHADGFADAFDGAAYRAFLGDVADRSLRILITEMDVLDDGLPANVATRDRAVADVYRRYLDVALAEPAVASLTTFGLSDRYTWLQEDYPREDGAARRPLPFDDALHPTPAYDALHAALASTPAREARWVPPRC